MRTRNRRFLWDDLDLLMASWAGSDGRLGCVGARTILGAVVMAEPKALVKAGAGAAALGRL